jgi:hypothetical protein
MTIGYHPRSSPSPCTWRSSSSSSGAPSYERVMTPRPYLSLCITMGGTGCGANLVLIRQRKVTRKTVISCAEIDGGRPLMLAAAVKDGAAYSRGPVGHVGPLGTSSRTPRALFIEGTRHRKRARTSARTFGPTIRPAATHWAIAPGDSLQFRALVPPPVWSTIY